MVTSTFWKSRTFNFANKAKYLKFLFFLLFLAGSFSPLLATNWGNLSDEVCGYLLTFVSSETRETLKIVSWETNRVAWGATHSCLLRKRSFSNGVSLEDLPQALTCIAKRAKLSPSLGTSLTKLQLYDFKHFTGDTLAPLPLFSDLTKFFIYFNSGGRGIRDENLYYITQLSKLEELHLSLADLTEKGLSSFSTLSHLTHLNLFNCRGLVGKGIHYIAQLSRLRSLGVSSRGLTDADVLPFSGLSNLTRLKLSADSMTGTVFAFFSNLLLTHLDLFNCNSLTNNGFFCVAAQFTGLESLDLSGCPLTDASLLPLTGLLSLTHLNLSDCQQIKGHVFAALSALSKLKSLDVSRYKASDANFLPLSCLSNLTQLKLGYCSQIQGEVFASFSTLSNLTHLDISECDDLIDKGIHHLAHLSGLRNLVVEGCNRNGYGEEMRDLTPISEFSGVTWINKQASKREGVAIEGGSITFTDKRSIEGRSVRPEIIKALSQDQFTSMMVRGTARYFTDILEDILPLKLKNLHYLILDLVLGPLGDLWMPLFLCGEPENVVYEHFMKESKVWVQKNFKEWKGLHIIMCANGKQSDEFPL